VISLAIALAPIVVLLVLLWLMDTFRLVRPTSILIAVAYGAAAARAMLWLHEWLLRTEHVSPAMLSRYIAPITEENGRVRISAGATARTICWRTCIADNRRACPRS
jgi:hypothetical protein